MPASFIARPACSVCGRPASHVELVEDQFGWRFIYSGPGGSNGDGDIVAADRAELLTLAFSQQPYRFAAIAATDLYDSAGFCGSCEAAYCPGHWNISETGYGKCPQGHDKSLDPHWSPDY